MDGILRIPKRIRDIFYYRQRMKNRVFNKLTAFILEESEKNGLSKKDVAEILNKDPAQITRWLAGPSNLTLETISDLLLAFNAELDTTIVRFSDRPIRNYAHPLIARVLNQSTLYHVMIPDEKVNRQIQISASTNNIIEFSV